MSHANGLVRFEDGTVRFFEYNGTADIPLPKLWENYAKVKAHWREDEPWKECACGKPPETVEAYTDYGSGMAWKTKACKSCGVITDTSDPYDLGEVAHGTPEWVRPVKWV